MVAIVNPWNTNHLQINKAAGCGVPAVMATSDDGPISQSTKSFEIASKRERRFVKASLYVCSVLEPSPSRAMLSVLANGE